MSHKFVKKIDRDPVRYSSEDCRYWAVPGTKCMNPDTRNLFQKVTQQYPSPLSNAYFDDSNIHLVQDRIIDGISKRTKGLVKMSRKNLREFDLTLVMLDVYQFQKKTNLVGFKDCDIDKQIQFLNQVIVDHLVPKIYNKIVGQMQYIRDDNTTDPLEIYPLNTRLPGQKNNDMDLATYYTGDKNGFGTCESESQVKLGSEDVYKCKELALGSYYNKDYKETTTSEGQQLYGGEWRTLGQVKAHTDMMGKVSPAFKMEGRHGSSVLYANNSLKPSAYSAPLSSKNGGVLNSPNL